MAPVARDQGDHSQCDIGHVGRHKEYGEYEGARNEIPGC